MQLAIEKNEAETVLESERRYQTLAESSPVGIFHTDASGYTTYVNPRWCKISGLSVEEALGNGWLNVVHEEDKAALIKGWQQATQIQEVSLSEYRFIHADGTIAWVMGQAVPEKNAENVVVGYIGTITDITERKKAEEAIKKSNERFEITARATNDILWDWDIITNEIWWNDNYYKLLGYERGESPPSIASWNKNIHPDDAKKMYDSIHKAIDTGKEYWYEEYRYLKHDGSFLFIYDRGFALYDERGKPYRMIGSMLDVTERINAEAEIKSASEELRQLTAHLQSIREEERKRIGREIHDELGQQLTAIKMDVAWIDKKIPEAEVLLKNKLKNIITLLDGSNQSIRRILSELRPGILDDRGLMEALEWLNSQFTSNTGIPVKLVITGKEIKSSRPVATCIFRVYQEALTNITRYAGASKVLTSLSIVNDNISLEIKDDGKGFDAASLQNKKSFGILGMKERVRSLEGNFELLSAPGKGTKIIISLPANILQAT